MQHLDDALIAEWVDGAIAEDSPQHELIAAHVDRCEECRLRVEEERALAGHVRQLLGVASPPDRTPPFEEILHRAGTAPRRAPVARGARWMRRLAWAATVVVAGGVGWYARGLVIGGPAATARSAVSGEAIGATGATGTTGALGAEQDEALTDAARLREQAPVGGRAPGSVEAREQAAGGERADVAGVEGRQERVTAERPAGEEYRTARRDAAPPAAPPAAAEPRPMAQAVAPAENELQMQKAALEPWTAVTPAAAEAVLGAPPVVLDGLPVTSIELSATGRAVRVRQDLGGGTMLELIQSRATDEVATGLAAGAVADAAPRARLARGAEAVDSIMVMGIRVIMRAAVSADSMRLLLERLGRER